MDFDNVFLITTVPVANAEAVLQALGDAGAGEIGLYTHCAFTNPGTGRFQPDAASNPAVGDRGVINLVDEVRIEMICRRDRVKAVLAALRAAHPYEEPGIYLLPMLSEADFE